MLVIREEIGKDDNKQNVENDIITSGNIGIKLFQVKI